jgi:16S rRNA (adenine1518-N6/adenine1519-N6)-dimethyltransferase
MFQREVAERIVAAPDTDAYGRLSVLTQWRAHAKILFDVHRSAFTPPPKVTSTVVRLEPKTDVDDVPLKALEAVTGAAFGQRRKMLRGSLKSLGIDTEALLAGAAINPEARAETIDLAGFMRLARAYAAKR